MSDAALNREDADARDRALDPHRSWIVQAPAGSGKTELLIQRYLLLLSRVDAPEEVLAITFTRKAAAEMLARVISALEAADADDSGLPPHEATTRRFARAVRDRDRELGWKLLSHSRRLRIQTLDSLNANIARMLPVSAAANVAGNSVADEAQTKALYRQAAVASLEWLTSDSHYAAAIETLLHHVDNNTGLYVDYLADMLGVRDQWLPIVGSGVNTSAEFTAMRRALEADLGSIRQQQVDLAENHLTPEQKDALTHIGRVAAGNMVARNQADHPIARMAEPERDVEWWTGAAELLLIKDGDWRARVTASIGLPPANAAEKSALMDLAAELDRVPGAAMVLHSFRKLPPAAYSDRQWSVLVALIQLLPLVVVELEALFARRGLTDFVEIARAADAALGDDAAPSDIALLLDYQVKHILVDEMQDTSLAQYGMIRALTRGWTAEDGRTLFCVGDPMQSIYRFRNAEVAQFLTARREGIGDISLGELILRRNFRSGEQLVDWYNAVFPHVLPAEDDPVKSAVAYAASVATEKHLGKGDIQVHPSLGTAKDAEAAIGFEVVKRLVDEYPDDSVAILVRGRSVLPDLLSRMKRAGIGYEAVDIDRLTDLPEAIDVLALTRAAVHPADRHAWLGVLRAPWIGLDWTDIHTLVRNDRSSTVQELLADPARIGNLSAEGQAALSRARPILDELVRARRFASLRDVVERSWLRLGGPIIAGSPDAIENVQRLLDVIGRIERAGTLDDVAELEAELDQERVSSNGPGRVSVMTMHKAKGLQFDHVVLYGLGRRSRHSGGEVLSWLELPPEHDRVRRVMSPIGPRFETDRDPVHAYIASIAEQRDRFEAGRLLYVACTRAIQSLHIVAHADVKDDGSAVKPPAPSSLLNLLWDDVQGDFAAALAEQGVPAMPEENVWRLPRLRRFDAPWSAPGDVLVPGGYDAGAAPREVVEFDWVGSAARLAGTLVHRWLYRVASGRDDFSAFADARADHLFRRWLDEAGAAQGEREDVLRRTRDALASMEHDEKGQWLVNGDGYAELSLTGLVDGEITTGVIDRVRIDGETHWIVDYKTSVHEGGNLEGFLAAESERYRSQLRRYRELYEAWSGRTARAALYFPLLARFVEVPA
jgi:ATP-dependent exoDNAse (exonuclease V) beta subunit